MKNKSIIIYSSWIAMSLASIAMLLIDYQRNPSNATPEALNDIQEELTDLARKMNEQTTPTTLKTVMAWLYPGEPACSAMDEAEEYKLDVIKPEYFLVQPGGRMSLLHEADFGCNGYSEANVARVKQLAPKQIVMVSASSAKNLDAFLIRDANTGEHVRQLVDFVVREDLTGIELDFEDFTSWTPQLYDRYKSFVTRLGNELHAQNKELMIDLPAVRNATEEQRYVLRLAELERLPVDALIIMAYDYQYDNGVGEAVTPLDWLDQVVKFTKERVTNKEKIVIGLPTYGYTGEYSGSDIRILTNEQASKYPFYSSAQRDPNSKEMIAVNGRQTLVFQDVTSVSAKVDVVTRNGIDKVSFWHLGGNPWFVTTQELY
jgi:spore germination protein YaaH